MRLTLTLAMAVVLVGLGACSKEPDPAPPAPAAPASAQAGTDAEVPPATAPVEAVFSQAELDQMVAPIALYPDPLLAQVLMASTYPGDVADAAKWSEAHPDASGDDAVKAVAGQPWDPSVQSLVAFPQALATLGQDPAWVQNLGDAFLAQPDAVMDAVQRLRHQAADAGNLESNEYQNVSTEQVPAAPVAADEAAPMPEAAGAVDTTPAPATTETIIIEPSNPEVVYVPSYNPTTAYGTWPYPSYPPTYYPPPPRYYEPGSALVNGMMFGVGVAVVDSLWGEPDWGYHGGYWGHGGGNYIDVDVNRYNRINANNRIELNDNSWRHNAVNRDGVPYRDNRSRQQYGRQLEGSERREAFRGDDAKRAQERENARKSIQQHGIEAPARSNTEARARAQEAARDRGSMAGGAAGADRSRDQARERAKAATDRAQATPQARERAQTAANKAKANPQARDRAQTAARSAKANPEQARAKAAQRANKPASNTQARQAARTQASQRSAPRNDAFKGASRPQASKAHAARGHSSQSHAQRPPQKRSAPKQVSRPSHPPHQQAHRGRR
ncbi:DUF3300 domain-containing protein [Marilutibacter aestuarii]|uniref:DUF3300 domain-containing protein n=1 Tax=Marilutibacter aestuarii TaxID=1706195 RepID=A0A508ADG2_9GAMM|nr:DUF3300 domain-containing protein [Lysobacter aestuarii]TQD46983.1 DUF3300 domain-containing protein [Lysobacter aestuarii]